ncbi:hypothetical protein OJ997_34935 [Solirubrobacter phytolaccae]|uniref:Uncharacterized protein n=1 Tax=Solirubrobacter phytolaccae TaxID=1404360 RepID=A0A9X3SC85_9ACTN|nr:hypothetical protein [Solirubrobacter phytolaccae]MDA0185553.1 hypothetical protein [Solirubrobacter phytolaccae]
MRKLAPLALAALLILVPAGTASAKTKVDAFATKYHLKGTWKSKDADKDGLKNLKEFKLGTDPRKADSDKDGLNDGDEVTSGNNPRKADTDGDRVKDGAEHAGVITAFDGETITIREFATGKKVTATLDTECTPALAEDETADDSSLDDGSVDVTEDEGFGAFFQDEGDDEDFGDDTADTASCDDDDLDKGVVLQSAELEDDYLVEYVIA